MQEFTDSLTRHHPYLIYMVIAGFAATTVAWLVWGWKNRLALVDFSTSKLPPLELVSTDLFFVSSLVLLLLSGVPLPIFQLLLVVAALCLWKIRTHSSLTYLNLTKAEVPRIFWVAGTLAMGIFLPLELLSGVVEKVMHHFGWPTPVQPAVELFLHAKSWHELVPIVLMATLAAPIAEEFLFRGLIYPATKKWTGSFWATLISSFLFAALHQHLPSFLPLMILGILLCRVFEITGSLWTGILVHASFNGVTASLLLLNRFLAHHAP